MYKATIETTLPDGRKALVTLQAQTEEILLEGLTAGNQALTSGGKHNYVATALSKVTASYCTDVPDSYQGVVDHVEAPRFAAEDQIHLSLSHDGEEQSTIFLGVSNISSLQDFVNAVLLTLHGTECSASPGADDVFLEVDGVRVSAADMMDSIKNYADFALACLNTEQSDAPAGIVWGLGLHTEEGVRAAISLLAALAVAPSALLAPMFAHLEECEVPEMRALSQQALDTEEEVENARRILGTPVELKPHVLTSEDLDLAFLPVGTLGDVMEAVGTLGTSVFTDLIPKVLELALDQGLITTVAQVDSLLPSAENILRHVGDDFPTEILDAVRQNVQKLLNILAEHLDSHTDIQSKPVDPYATQSAW